MRFQRLDLNLLVALDALFAERNVSRAGQRIGLSQSATSSALARLRDYFQDELLVMKGRQMVLTARAESLVAPVRAVLEQIRATISVAPAFDPQASERTISIMASDYVTEVLLSPVLAGLGREAPRMRFEIQPMSDEPVASLERGQVDLLVTADFAVSPDHPKTILFEDDYVVIGWQGNRALAGPMSRELYFELGHATVRLGKTNVPAFEDWFVRQHRQQRRIEVYAPSFLTLPGLVVGSDRIATVHRRLADRVISKLPLVAHEAPFDIPSIRETIQWHSANDADAGLRWFVDSLITAARA